MTPWGNWEFSSELNRLSSLIEIIEKNTGIIPDQLISLSERVCISICSSFEHGVKKIIFEYTKIQINNVNDFVVELTRYRLKQVRNLKSNGVKHLVKLFDPNFTYKSNNETILNELVDKRIAFAHETGGHSHITIRDLKKYLNAYKSFLESLQGIF
ncbi:MAG: HEPN domain-containing protein [Rhodobacteraceae bacterium]|nr:HEPN domain-containing protein [Paracoccaceae bacterium]MCY4250852.1 HEPN domain-containing protein [Paracoccaceae bacterium]